MIRAVKSKTIKYFVVGLATALLLMNCSAFSVIVGYGSTVNDLREYLGIAVDEQESAKDKVYEVEISGGKNSSDKSGTSESTSSSGQSEINLAKLEGRFKQSIQNESSAKVLVNLVNSIVSTKEEIDNSVKNQYYQDMMNTSDVVSDSFSDAEEELDLMSGNYMIGDIGSNAISVVDGHKVLVTPWGYMLDSNNNLSEKLLGIDLFAQPGDNICSQWQGVIESVKDDGNGGSTITIYHGNRLYTQYSHVTPLQGISAGEQVNQGEIIGTAIETTIKEHTKDNHIFYQINIDNEYINPLLIYGDSGERLYDNWYKSSTDTNLIEEGEEYFKTEPDFSYSDTEKYTQGNADVVLYPDFNLDN